MVKRKQKGSQRKKKVQKMDASQTRSSITLGATYKNQLELELEERVFGGVADVVGRLAPSDGETTDASEDEEGRVPERRPAWQDDDDDISIEGAFRAQGKKTDLLEDKGRGFSKLLRRKFVSVVGNPKWAQLDRNRTSGSDSEDEGLLRRCGRFVVKDDNALGKGHIQVKRHKDLNMQSYAEGPLIKAAQFHPTATVALVAGSAGIASLFQVDGVSNTKLQSISFERFPISCARFTTDGNQFYCGSLRYRHLYCHDMLSGKSTRVLHAGRADITNMKSFEMSPDGRLMASLGRFGHVHLMTVGSQELVGGLKMDGNVTAVAFSPDGSRLYSHGDSGEVYVWDVASRSCLHRFTDDGCIAGSSLAASPSGQFLACGSSSGIVNLYETSSALSSDSPRPLKIFPNLTTAANALRFDGSSQLLAMASSDKDNAIRLAHVQSLTVYANFPLRDAKVFRAQCVDFSLSSGYLAVGNNRNAALLYRLKSFGNY